MPTVFILLLLLSFTIGSKAGYDAKEFKIEFTKNPPESINESSDSTGLQTCYQFNLKYNNKFITCIRGTR